MESLFTIYNELIFGVGNSMINIPFTFGNDMRIIADIYWPTFTPYGSYPTDYASVKIQPQGWDASGSTITYYFNSELYENAYENTDRTDRMQFSIGGNSTPGGSMNTDGKGHSLNSYGNDNERYFYAGDGSLVIDRYNEGTYKPTYTTYLNGKDSSSGQHTAWDVSYIKLSSTKTFSANYADTTVFPGYYNPPVYDQNNVWVSGPNYWGNISPSNGKSWIHIDVWFTGVVNGSIFKIYDLKLEKYNTSTGEWDTIDTYVPCTYQGTIGLVNNSRTIFAPVMYDYAPQVKGNPFVEFNELFPTADVHTYSSLRYNDGDVPVEAYKVFDNMEALLAFKNNSGLHQGEVVSVINDSSHNGLYHVIGNEIKQFATIY